MVQIRVHYADAPQDSWLEVDGKKVEGPLYVVCTWDDDSFSLSVSGALGQGVEIVKDEQ
jgi:hypothetical protein